MFIATTKTKKRFEHKQRSGIFFTLASLPRRLLNKLIKLNKHPTVVAIIEFC